MSMCVIILKINIGYFTAHRENESVEKDVTIVLVSSFRKDFFVESCKMQKQSAADHCCLSVQVSK